MYWAPAGVGEELVGQQFVAKGSKPKGLLRASRRYAKGRVCAADGCSTILSQYNRREKCWAHADHKIPRLRGRNPPPAQGLT
jgi:hypothetical protein